MRPGGRPDSRRVGIAQQRRHPSLQQACFFAQASLEFIDQSRFERQGRGENAGLHHAQGLERHQGKESWTNGQRHQRIGDHDAADLQQHGAGMLEAAGRVLRMKIFSNSSRIGPVGVAISLWAAISAARTVLRLASG